MVPMGVFESLEIPYVCDAVGGCGASVAVGGCRASCVPQPAAQFVSLFDIRVLRHLFLWRHVLESSSKSNTSNTNGTVGANDD